MNFVLNLTCVIVAIILISFGVNSISQPSNLKVYIGVFEIIVAFIILYFPIQKLFKKL